MSEIVTHAMLLVAAVAIAFSLPSGIHFFIYRWWPMVSANPDLLFLTEVCLAAVLVAVFISIKSTLQNRDFVDSAKLASLVHASHKGDWMTRWRERLLVKKVPASGTACVMTVTGYDTFAHQDSQFRQVLQDAPYLDFDFETDELVQRDIYGNELGRALLPRSPHAEKKLAIARHSQCALTGYIPNEA